MFYVNNLCQPFSKMADMIIKMPIYNDPISIFLLNIFNHQIRRFYHKMNNILAMPPHYLQSLTLTFTFRLVTHQLEAVVAAATEGSVEVGAVVLTAAIVSQTLVHVCKIKVRQKVAIASFLLSIIIPYGCC